MSEAYQQGTARTPIRLLVVIGSLNRGGCERHLLGVLPALDPDCIKAEVFVLDERGELAKEGLAGEIPEIRDIAYRFTDSSPSENDENVSQSVPDNVMPEKVAGLFTVRLKLKLGDVPADDLIKIAKIADEFGQGLVRTT